MGNLFSNENTLETDVSNNLILYDVSGNVTDVINMNNIQTQENQGLFDIRQMAGMIAPIDKFGNRVRKR
jgi:hypothetical protein